MCGVTGSTVQNTVSLEDSVICLEGRKPNFKIQVENLGRPNLLDQDLLRVFLQCEMCPCMNFLIEPQN